MHGPGGQKDQDAYKPTFRGKFISRHPAVDKLKKKSQFLYSYIMLDIAGNMSGRSSAEHRTQLVCMHSYMYVKTLSPI